VTVDFVPELFFDESGKSSILLLCLRVLERSCDNCGGSVGKIFNHDTINVF